MDLEGDNGLDSVANFFLSWNRIELDEEASVPGGIVDGETVLFGLGDVQLQSYFSISWVGLTLKTVCTGS